MIEKEARVDKENLSIKLFRSFKTFEESNQVAELTVKKLFLKFEI